MLSLFLYGAWMNQDQLCSVSDSSSENKTYYVHFDTIIRMS
jgi:hypothetical protein